MFKNYFKIAWRVINRHKAFSIINIGGLAIGMAAVLLITLYIQTELSYDNFHKNGNDIYRVGFSSKDEKVATEFTAPFSVDAQKQFPEIKSYCRVSESHDSWFLYQNKSIKTSTLKYTDETFFSLFSFRLIAGNTADALKNPYSIVLSKNIAGKIFGNENAVGKMITVNGNKNYLVTGIAENAPENSTIQYDAIASISTLYHDTTYFMGWNGGWQYQHFLLLQPNTDMAGLQGKFKNFMWANFNEKIIGTHTAQWLQASLQPLTKIHLWYDDGSANTRTNIYVFGIVAVLVLVISCINYINLSIAGASSRFKEIGVRKVLGAVKKQLVKQFLSETLLITLFGLILAMAISMLVFPLYQDVLGKGIALSPSQIIFINIVGIILVGLISLIAGGYLSFYLSSLKPATIFKMQMPKSGKQKLSNSLIIVQFAVSVALISAVFIVQMQLQYIKNKSLGFDKEHTLVLTLTGDEVQKKALLLKQQVAGLAGVTSVSAMSEVPYNNITQNGFLPEDRKDWVTVHELDADENLLKTMNIALKAGKYFSSENQSENGGYVINQALADELGWQQPIGKTITRNGVHKIIGVVQNFHFASLHDKIAPLIVTNNPDFGFYNFLVIKYNGNNPSPLIALLNNVWKNNASAAPFDYWFLDAAFNALYKSEQKFQQLFFYFSVLSIILSLAGVFGLVLLTIQQKTKEIGIRKILGAGMVDIVELVAGKYVYLIVIAFIVAALLTWVYVNQWLQGFAYRIHTQWWMFLLPALVVLFFALMVISIQTYKAGLANPVKSLRTE
jgi:ABC-type antimicrobial peptide transport system, permease component